MTPNHFSPRAFLLGTAISLGLLSLAACGNKDAPKPTTQVAARVGSEEISLYQINAALAQANNQGVSPEQQRVLSRNVLEGLIDQQVAVDRAIDAKLNRDPDVMAQIEAARRAVLANAYVKQYVTSLPKTAPQDASKYYSEHPALFAERRVYTVQEIVVPRSPEVLEQLNSMAAADKSMDEVAAWLKAHQLNFTPSNSSRAAEQIPLDLLPRMHALQDGHDLAFSTPAAVTILRLVSSRTQAVPESVALPRIAQYLSTQRTESAITDHIKALRTHTSVVYLGEFAPSTASATSALK